MGAVCGKEKKPRKPDNKALTQPGPPETQVTHPFFLFTITLSLDSYKAKCR